MGACNNVIDCFQQRVGYYTSANVHTTGDVVSEQGDGRSK